MVSSISSALSGMQTWQLRQDISANDIANVNTQGYSQKIPVQSTNAVGNPQISAITSEPNAAGNDSNTDLATELVEQKMSVHGYGADAKVIKVQDQMTQSLLDVIG